MQPQGDAIGTTARRPAAGVAQPQGREEGFGGFRFKGWTGRQLHQQATEAVSQTRGLRREFVQ